MKDITWRVGSIDVETNGFGLAPVVEIEVVGIVHDPSNLSGASYHAIRDRLEAAMNGLDTFKPSQPYIKDVIFNPPATIVFWSDGTKTVVKDQGEENGYDPEKGLAMAISKKMLGNNYSYYNTFAKWLKRYEKATVDKFVKYISEPETVVSSLIDKWKQAIINLGKTMEELNND